MDNLGVLIQCYNENSFEALQNALDEKCAYRSQWVFDEMVGSENIVRFLVAKSRSI